MAKNNDIPSAPIGEGNLGPRARLKNLKLDPPKENHKPKPKKKRIKKKVLKNTENVNNPKHDENAKNIGHIAATEEHDVVTSKNQTVKVLDAFLNKLINTDIVDISTLEQFIIEDYEP